MGVAYASEPNLKAKKLIEKTLECQKGLFLAVKSEYIKGKERILIGAKI